jgi:hypothetical protein
MSLASLPRVSNPVTSAVWVDAATLLMRGDIPVATMQLYHFMPEAAIEVVRVQTSKSNLIAMIDLFAKITGHYPTKPAAKAKA